MFCLLATLFAVSASERPVSLHLSNPPKQAFAKPSSIYMNLRGKTAENHRAKQETTRMNYNTFEDDTADPADPRFQLWGKLSDVSDVSAGLNKE